MVSISLLMCILATWAQELVSVSCGFRKVYTGPCGLGNTHMINLPGCTEPASGLYEAREILYEVHRIRSDV